MKDYIFYNADTKEIICVGISTREELKNNCINLLKCVNSIRKTWGHKIITSIMAHETYTNKEIIFTFTKEAVQ